MKALSDSEITMRLLRLLFFLLPVLAFLGSAPHPCSAADRCSGIADERFFSKVKSWSGLRKWFESYADCDDGGLAEGISDYAVVSLAQHWRDLPELKRQIEKNSRFEAFVLRHIDATTDSDDLKKVVENATQRCPEHSTALCSSIAGAARAALDEIGHPQQGSLHASTCASGESLAARRAALTSSSAEEALGASRDWAARPRSSPE
jgi:hypothetical protein